MSKSPFWILAITSLSTGLVFLDNTVLPVALATIEKQLHLSSIASLWVVNSYLLTMGVLFLIGGRLADLLGKKNCYLSGLSLFGLGSLLGGLSVDYMTLLAARIIQGMGAALVSPTTGALLITYFPKWRAQAIGINMGIGSFFMMVGPLVGGMLTEWLSWRYIFWMNLPLVLAALIFAKLILKKEKRGKGSFHFLGALPLIFSLSSFVLAFMQAPSWGWSSVSTLLLLLSSLLFFLLFIYVSKKTLYPLFDIMILKCQQFRLSIYSIFLIQMVVMLSVFFPFCWQKQMGMGPFDSGLLLMIASVPVIIAAPFAGFLSDRLNPRLPIQIGFLMVLFSLVWLYFLTSCSYFALLPALFGFGFGIPMIVSPAFAKALSSITSDKLGSGSSLVATVRQIAAAVGLALMSALFHSTLDNTDSYQASLSALLILSFFFSLAGFFLSRRIKN